MRNWRFSKILISLLYSVTLLRGQTLTWYERVVLLEKPRSVSGVVVDPSGRPVAGAHMDHTDVKEPADLFTDNQGRFHFQTGAPAMVVRKLGFNGKRISLMGDSPLVVGLRPATRILPKCAVQCSTLNSANSVFCVSSIHGVESTKPGWYADTVTQAYKIATKDGQRELLHGAGSTWTLGIPYTGDVWEAADYSENQYRLGDSDVLDARGRSPNGKLWRYLGRFGESASYYDVDQSASALLDKVLDGVCAP